jgi:ABC-type multidrug transport system permease subunit
VIKGVSGGEKKRTNIGTELITNPPIMMLDEPTSGLDSVSALRIGHLLRDLAHEEGRTVVCTLHTPSSELFRVFDDILLMAKGHAIYHGPIEGAKTFFASIGMPPPARVNPSEYYMRILQSPEDVLDKMAAAWVEYSQAQEAAGTNLSICGPPATIHLKNAMLDKLVADRAPSSLSMQLVALSGRSWRNTMRDPMLTYSRAFQVVFFGLLLGLMFINLETNDSSVQDRTGVLNSFAMQVSMMSLFPALLTFPNERPVFIQDMTNNLYSAHMYYWSKVVVELPIHIVVPIGYAIIVYFMTHLVRTAECFFIFLLISVVLGYTAQALGMMLSAIFKDAQTSMAMGPMIIMPLILVAGLLANTERLEPGWIWLEYMSPVRYAFKAYIRNEYMHLPVLDGPRYKTGWDVVRGLGFTKDSDRWQVDVGAMVAYMMLFRVLGSAALWYHGTKNNAKLPYQRNFQLLHGVGAPAVDDGDGDVALTDAARL